MKGPARTGRSRFFDAVAEAVWRSGPGEPCLLIVDDDEFRREFSGHQPMVAFPGYLTYPYDVFGSKVHIICERLRISPAPSDRMQSN